MKLYSLPLSPFASRVRLAIYLKGLDIEIVAPPEGGTKGARFLSLNPMGTVPTLEGNGVAIPESATIIEYLEDRFPAPSLYPANIEDRARARLFLRLPDLYFQGAPRVLISMRDPAYRNEEAFNAAIENIDKTLTFMNHYVDAAQYAVGGRPSIADCALVPILNVLGAVMPVLGITDSISRHSNLQAYWERAQHEEINGRVIKEMQMALTKMMGH